MLIRSSKLKDQFKIASFNDLSAPDGDNVYYLVCIKCLEKVGPAFLMKDNSAEQTIYDIIHSHGAFHDSWTCN